MVENDKAKQDFLRTRFPRAKHVFNDVTEMHHKMASTWDGSHHTVPKVGHPNILLFSSIHCFDQGLNCLKDKQHIMSYGIRMV